MIFFTQATFRFEAYYASFKVSSVKFNTIIASFLSCALNRGVLIVIAFKALYNLACFVVYRY